MAELASSEEFQVENQLNVFDMAKVDRCVGEKINVKITINIDMFKIL
ncbi:hypothetical protein J4204_04430 [Candidatus Woesearchaeota archaeon]|nr:hypothetical protein [Candidatus Woesearchaeota archaeon]